MDEDDTKPTRGRTVAVVSVLVAVVGAAAFWEWRKRAPLARSYRRWRRDSAEKRDEKDPSLGYEPETNSV